MAIGPVRPDRSRGSGPDSNHPYGGFSDVTFQNHRGGVALLLLGSLFSSAAFANGRGLLLCNTCTTVSDFSNLAENWVFSNANLQLNGVEIYQFAIFNPTDKLLGEVSVTHFYDRETGGSSTHVRNLTGTVADMQQAYKTAIPDLGLTYIPSNVASTYTGSSQQQVVGPYLASYFSDSNPVQGQTTLAVFPDYSSAVYQLTNAGTSDWTFVHNSGHDSNGEPLSDNVQPVTTAPPPGTIMTPPIPADGGQIIQHPGGGGYGVSIWGLDMWVNGVIYCMINGCTRVPG